MEDRLAMTAVSIKALEEKLSSFLAKENDIDGLYRGQAKGNKDPLGIIAVDEDMANTVETWIAKGKYKKLLNLWVKGLTFDWNKLYKDIRPKRISLPTYPFAKERFWVPELLNKPVLWTGGIHPFPERSIPCDNGRRLTSTSTVTAAKPEGILLRSAADVSQLPISRHQKAAAPTSARRLLSQPKSHNDAELFLQTQQTGRLEALQTELAAGLAESLYMSQDDVDLDAKFVDLGMDSIVAVEWIKRINQQYNLSIPATKVYDYPNIREFTGFLAKEWHPQTKSTAAKAVVQTLTKPNTSIGSRQRLNSTSPAITGTPDGVLPLFMANASPAKKSRQQTRIVLSSESDSLLQTERNNAAKPLPPARQAVSRKALQAELAAGLAESLYMSPDDIDADAGFVDMGMDSIIAVEWIKTINHRHHLSIPATKIYDYPNLREFTRYLSQEFPIQTKSAVVNRAIPVTDRPLSEDPRQRKSLQPPLSQARDRFGEIHNEKKRLKKNAAAFGDDYGLVISTVHSINELSLRQWIVPEPQSNEVTIQVKASAINFPDVMCVKGLYPTMPDRKSVV